MSKNSGVGLHKFHCIYKITAVMKVETEIISSIVASPTEIIVYIGIIIICLMSLTDHFEFVDTDNMS